MHKERMTSHQLKAWRKQRNLTQRQAADELGVKLVTLQKWEQNRHRISLTAQKLIARLTSATSATPAKSSMGDES